MTVEAKTPGMMPERSRRGAASPAIAGRARGTGRIVLPLEHLGAAFLLALVVTLVLCGLSLLVLDEPVARAVLTAPPWLRQAGRVITAFGLSGYMIVGAAVLALASYLLARREPRATVKAGLRLLFERACFVLATVVVSGIMAQLLKHLVGRARPKLIDTLGPAHFDLFSIKASLASFPSGHATSIFALTVALYLIAPRSGKVMLAAAILVSASRVLVGSHYPSDVIAGAALGCLVAVGLAIAFARREIVFTTAADGLRLKGPGTVLPAVRARLKTPGVAT